MLGLTIHNPDNLDLTTFCKFLISRLRARAADTSKLNIQQVKRWDEYLDEIFKDYTTKPTTKLIINKYFDNLTVIKDTNDNSYTILCNKNIKYPMLNIPIDTLANMINDGTLDRPRYDIFDQIYHDVEIQVPILYKLWRGM